jgi:hypothetical protein
MFTKPLKIKIIINQRFYMQASFSPFSPNQVYANLPTRDTTFWSNSKKRLVSLITSQASLVSMGLSLGVISGMAALWMIDQKSPKTHEGYNCVHWERHNYPTFDLKKEEDLKKQELQARLKRIYKTSVSVILGSVPFVIATFRSTTSIPIFFSSFAIGFTLGVYGKEYHHRHSSAKIKEFVQWLKQNYRISPHLSREFDIAYYYDYLKYFDLTKLGQEIQENYTRCHTLAFQSCHLTDRDLINLKKASWFTQFKAIIFNKDTRYPLQSCPKITIAGLKQVMEAGVQVLKTLDLSQTNLADEDLIQMADSNCFVHLNKLSIRNNPKITGKGLGYIIEKGFDDLTMLDISGNSQLLGSELDHWVGKKGFNELTSLEFDHMDLTENNLERMLNEVEWFGHLKGLKIEHNPKLKRIPNNIDKLTSLIPNSSFPIEQQPVYYYGQGLFIRQYNNEEFLKSNSKSIEFHKLIKAHQVTLGKIDESMP